MKILKTKIKGPLIIKSKIFEDKRGYLIIWLFSYYNYENSILY